MAVSFLMTNKINLIKNFLIFRRHQRPSGATVVQAIRPGMGWTVPMPISSQIATLFGRISHACKYKIMSESIHQLYQGTRCSPELCSSCLPERRVGDRRANHHNRDDQTIHHNRADHYNHSHGELSCRLVKLRGQLLLGRGGEHELGGSSQLL